MSLSEIQILIPCHSLEDFPTEHTDEPAASLLNSFAVAFHPQLLAWTSEFPRWHRADDPPLPRRGQLILIPTVSDSWLPYQWVDDARAAGAIVVSGLSDRNEMLAEAFKVLDVAETSPAPSDAEHPQEPQVDSDESASTAPVESMLPEIDPELVADFLSLGTCWLIVELLTRRMRQYGNVDESRFFQKAQAAAHAAIADDAETTTQHLQSCFEMLLEARERFYPVECYLLDLCLAVPDLDQDRLLPELKQAVPFSLLASAKDLAELCEKIPDLKSELASSWQSGQVSLIGGEDREVELSLLPFDSVIQHFDQGLEQFRSLFNRVPSVWGRRHFALSALLPQLLGKFGYHAALHVMLDDGIYPDAEYTKLRWRGVDGTLIDALSRIPLASDSAASYLRFANRMAESMDHDQVAGLMLARWPKVSAPWFEDLRRSQKYAPCLGRFVTLERFFEQTELPGQLSTYKPEEYFSPILIQHVARREGRAISRYSEHQLARHRWNRAAWPKALSSALKNRSVSSTDQSSLSVDLESVQPDAQPFDAVDFNQRLLSLEQTGLAELSALVLPVKSAAPGLLVFNTLSFSRRTVVELPASFPAPAVGGAIKTVDVQSNRTDRVSCVVELPGSGYVWIPRPAKATAPAIPRQPLAEPGLLRNDLFEVAINVRTGGIGHVRFHNQRAKRLSQQLSFRFPRERVIQTGPDRDDTTKSQYAEMVCRGHEVTANGTACGEITTWGEIIDQAKNEKLASFRQVIRVRRGLPTIELEMELSDIQPFDGDPWNNYFASRFAWNDSSASVTRSIFHSAHPFTGERFETSDYIEVASSDERLTIVPHGLPFHRKTSERMLDSLLVVAGEEHRLFRFTIAIDADYPLEAAWNAVTAPLCMPTENSPPSGGSSGWFFHLDARNAQITRILEVTPQRPIDSPLLNHEQESIPAAPGFALRILETEGRSRRFKLRCFRTPTYARKRNFLGETISELMIQDDTVLFDLAAFEFTEIELRFGNS